mgnify:CR=1 FL=1|jgi:tripartite-type tricarboxylate transporter receptor subunit TctC
MIKKILPLLLCLCMNTIHASPIKLVVPVAPGATMDSIARTLAPELAKKLGKDVIVENKAGASGAIAMRQVINSEPDGLTLALVNNGTLNMSPILNTDAGFSSSSFTSIGLVGISPLVLVVSTKIPATNLKELTEYARNNPGSMSWASPGTGSTLHLSGELLKNNQNLDMVHVMYKGMSQAMIDLVEGRVTMVFDVANPVITNFIELNKIRPIAVTGNKRIESLATVATVKEQGYSFLQTDVWFGVSVSAKTPEPIVNQLRVALADVLENQSVKEKLKQLGVGPSGVKYIEAQRYIDNERDRWNKVIKQANIKVN